MSDQQKFEALAAITHGLLCNNDYWTLLEVYFAEPRCTETLDALARRYGVIDETV